MADFYEFLKQRELMALPGPSGNLEVRSEVSQAVSHSIQGSSITDGDASKFAAEVGDFVMSDDFLLELSDMIGRPEGNESKEEFVQRCKATMFDILTKRLG
jgi:hypothetical protein